MHILMQFIILQIVRQNKWVSESTPFIDLHVLFPCNSQNKKQQQKQPLKQKASLKQKYQLLNR